MSDRKPSAGALRAAERIFWLMQNCRFPKQEDRSVASIIDAGVQPLVDALRGIALNMRQDDRFIDPIKRDMCIEVIRAALADWEGRPEESGEPSSRTAGKLVQKQE